MIAHIPQREQPLLGLCGTPLLGIAAPPEAPRCVVCLDLDAFGEEDRQVVALEESTPGLPVGGRAGGRSSTPAAWPAAARIAASSAPRADRRWALRGVPVRVLHRPRTPAPCQWCP
jgi:hypothetical protein